jgi:hypothetical protein
MWRVTDEQFKALLAAEGAHRYQHFINRVSDMEELWGLMDAEGWASGRDDGTGQETFAVWPHERYAEACAVGPWEGRKPERIAVSEWLDGWTGDLEEAGQRVAVFPVPDGRTVTAEPARLAEDLRTELARYS